MGLGSRNAAKPDALKNEVWLSTDSSEQMAWHMAAGEGHVKILEKLWDWAKEMQLKPEQLRDDVFWTDFKKRSGIKLQEGATFKY